MKKKVLLWCQEFVSKEYNLEIKNFNTSFQDGRCIIAIIHKIDPQNFNFELVSQVDIKESLKFVFNLAKEDFGIEELLDPEDVFVKVKENMIYAYLIQVYVFWLENKEKFVNSVEKEKKVKNEEVREDEVKNEKKKKNENESNNNVVVSVTVEKSKGDVKQDEGVEEKNIVKKIGKSKKETRKTEAKDDVDLEDEVIDKEEGEVEVLKTPKKKQKAKQRRKSKKETVVEDKNDELEVVEDEEEGEVEVIKTPKKKRKARQRRKSKKETIKSVVEDKDDELEDGEDEGEGDGEVEIKKTPKKKRKPLWEPRIRVEKKIKKTPEKDRVSFFKKRRVKKKAMSFSSKYDRYQRKPAKSMDNLVSVENEESVVGSKSLSANRSKNISRKRNKLKKSNSVKKISRFTPKRRVRRSKSTKSLKESLKIKLNEMAYNNPMYRDTSDADEKEKTQSPRTAFSAIFSSTGFRKRTNSFHRRGKMAIPIVKSGDEVGLKKVPQSARVQTYTPPQVLKNAPSLWGDLPASKEKLKVKKKYKHVKSRLYNIPDRYKSDLYKKKQEEKNNST